MDTSSPLFLGIDLGTSGCRGIVINEQEHIIAEARINFHSDENNNRHHQQDAGVWWQAIVDVTQHLGNDIELKNITAISVDGTSGTVLLCDKNGNPLHDALMYNDARATNECDQLKKLGIENCVVLSPTSGLAKLLWLKKQSFSKEARYFLHQADWVNGKFLNCFGDSDVNNALKTGFDPVNRLWPTWFKQLGIDDEWLPVVHQPGDSLGTIDKTVAQQLGLNNKTQIITGTTDSTAAIIATGINKVGEAVTSLGSTLVTKVIAEQPVANEEYGVYSQPFGDYWLAGGASNSGGAVLKQFFTSKQLDDLSKQLRPEKPTGLEYYPLPFKGERFPDNNPEKLPVLLPRPEDDTLFFQGILEGIAKIEKQAYQRLHELGAPYPSHVLTCGGGASNQPWCKIREQLLKVTVKAAQQQEAAFGAALLAKRNRDKK